MQAHTPLRRALQSLERTGRRSPVAVVILLYLSLTIYATWPLALNLTDHVLGDARSDIWAHLWGYYRTERDVLQDHSFPYHVDYINHPKGGELYHIDLLNSLLMLPLKAALGQVLAYNALVWLHLTFGCTFMFLLMRRFVRHPPAAFLPGLIFAFNPLTLSFALASGVSERLNATWFPLYFLFLLRVLDEGKVRNFVLAALMLMLATVGCYKYGLFLLLLTLAFSIFLLARPLAARVAGAAWAGVGGEYGRLLLRKLAPLALTCGLFVAPFGLLASMSLSSSGALMQRRPRLFWDGESWLQGNENIGLSVKDFFVPAADSLRVTQELDVLYQCVYLGASVLLLALASMAHRGRFARFFLPGAGLFFILALGPRFRLTEGADPYTSVLYELLARVVPFLPTFHNPWELTLVVLFCLAVAAGCGLEVLTARLSGRWRWAASLAAVAVVVVEVFHLAPNPSPLPMARAVAPSFHRALAAEAGDHAVFDFPPYRPGSRLRPEEYLFYQTVHHKPVPHAINQSWLDRDPFWRELAQLQQGLRGEPRRDPAVLRNVRTYLVRHRFRHFVVHRRQLQEDLRARFLQLFAEMFGPPVFRDQEVVVFGIRPSKR